MDEIPEPLKKILVFNATLAFISAILYIGPIDIISAIFGWPGFNPLYKGIFGGSQLIFGIFAFLEVYQKELKRAIVFLELLIAWQVTVVLVSVNFSIIFSSLIEPTVILMITNAILLVMILINIYFYRRYRK